MTDTFTDDFRRALDDCAEALAQALIEKTGSNQVAVGATSAFRWSGPAMRLVGDYAGIPLNNFPRWLYMPTEEYDLPYLLSVYEQAVSALLTKGSVAAAAAPHFPRVQFKESGSDNMARLVCAMSWFGGQLTVGIERIELRLVGHLLGFDTHKIRTQGTWSRLPVRSKSRPLKLLNGPAGSLRTSMPATGAVYATLINALPNERKAIDTVLKSAVEAGRDFEEVIHRHFQFYRIDDNLKGLSPFQKAEVLIETAVICPNEKLWDLLRPYIPYREFMKGFGNAGRVKSVYTESMREKHREALARLNLMRLPDAAIVQDDPDAMTKEVAALLNFNNQLGRRA